MFLYLLEESFTLALDVIGEFDVIVFANDSLQQLFSMQKINASEIVTVEINDIEDEISDDRLSAFLSGGAIGLQSEPWLQQLKSRNAVFIQRDNFAVKNGFVGF